MLDLKIVNGRVADLKERCFKPLQVGIKGDKIACLGADLPEALETIDARGHVVSPGFIDIHMHEEEFSLTGDSWDIADCMLRMGVTTAVGGNCGSNRQWPYLMEERAARMGSPINYMAFIGHNFLRELAGNLSPRAESSPAQIEQMARMARDAVDDGAVGVSYDIEYAQGMTFAEEVGICKYIKGRRDLLLAAHYREDGPGALPSIDEMAALCREIGIPFQISHLSSCSAYGNMKEALELIEKYRESGLDILADAYPYNAFCTSIGSDVFKEGCFEHLGVTVDSVELTEDPYRNVRCTQEIFEDARRNYPEMLAVAHVMREEEIAMAVAHPLVMVASDGLYRHSKGHPRGAGTFPRFLGKYVRERKVCDFFTGLAKVTSMPAKRLRLDGCKGRIEEGYDADIVIFDPETIIDKADFGDTAQAAPEGLDWVLVNGRKALKGKDILDRGCGRYIRRP